MTLFINVTSIEKLENSGVLVVEGSKAGLLYSQQIESDHEFHPPFLIKCASSDTLNFKVSKDLKDYQSGNYFAQGSLPGFVLAKKCKSQIMGQNNYNYDENGNYVAATYFQQQQPNQNNQEVKVTNPLIPSNITYLEQLQLTDQHDQNAGIVKFSVSFDRVSHFQGQLCTTSQKYPSVIRRGQKLALYKGKCKTKNLFSLIDPACQDQKMKFIESIYKDGDQVV